AGHPELIFELDGQSVAEPKHWSTERNGNGAQAWLVGQAVALREMSWQLAKEQSPTENEINRWAGLGWLVQSATSNDIIKQKLTTEPGQAIKAAAGLQSESDEIARDVATAPWTDEMTHKMLVVLAGTSVAFRDASVSQPAQARRAERLVLALDRLTAAKNNHKGEVELNQLFKLAQSVPDFDAKGFADVLDKYSAAINAP
ncbi:MAG: hypothetical protein JF609_01765, partial [Verrucomicrobia bacterium]|nr:hypothetical protein [Verrucomicrobiota bacterium]